MFEMLSRFAAALGDHARRHDELAYALELSERKDERMRLSRGLLARVWKLDASDNEWRPFDELFAAHQKRDDVWLAHLSNRMEVSARYGDNAQAVAAAFVPEEAKDPTQAKRKRAAPQIAKE